MVNRDLASIVEVVAPQNSQGAANVAQVRHFLRNLLEKQYLQPDEHARFDATLVARDTQTTHDTIQVTISKEDILRRFEEDRERHKKLRETVWVVPNRPPDAEFNQAWDETSDLCDDDYDAIREDLNLYKSSLIRV